MFYVFKLNHIKFSLLFLLKDHTSDGLDRERDSQRLRLSARFWTQDTSVCDLWLGLFKISIRPQVGSLGLSYGEPFQSLI